MWKLQHYFLQFCSWKVKAVFIHSHAVGNCSYYIQHTINFAACSHIQLWARFLTSSWQVQYVLLASKQVCESLPPLMWQRLQSSWPHAPACQFVPVFFYLLVGWRSKGEQGRHVPSPRKLVWTEGVASFSFYACKNKSWASYAKQCVSSSFFSAHEPVTCCALLLLTAPCFVLAITWLHNGTLYYSYCTV